MRSAVLAGLLLILASGSASAESTCQFEISGATMRLLDDCTTDVAIEIPDGMTLDGGQHAIIAVDPLDGLFRGGVIVNAGASASIVNTIVSTLLLADACQMGTGRLRGISFDGASGVIRGNAIINVNKGPSACPEGNGIEVRNGNVGGRPVVEIAGNIIDGYQKTGIAASGNVDVWIHHNDIGASAAQSALAANAIQIGPGAGASIEVNTIRGNSWAGGDAAGTAVLLVFSAPDTVVRFNTIVGNADVGIYVRADRVRVTDNQVTDEGADGSYDVGIGNYGTGNVISGNRIRGFTTRYQGVADDSPAGLTVASR